MNKKSICALLCALLTLPVFASCGGNGDTSQPDISAPSGASEPAESDIASQPDGDAAAIDKLFTETLPEEREYINIISGESYVIGIEPNELYPDDGVKLTDTAATDYSSTDGWVGFLGKDDITVIFDLGEVKTGLCGFSIDVLMDSARGRGIPKSAVLYVSQDGENYVKAASCAVFSIGSADTKAYTLEAYTESGFSARYAKLVLGDIMMNWTLIDSFGLYTAKEKIVEPTSPSVYYINEDMPDVTEAVYWSENESDYGDTVNLISGLGQRIYTYSALTDDLKTSYYNTPASTKLLTDGNHGGDNYNDSAYFHMTRGFGRDIVYDIGKVSALSSATVGAYIYPDYAITYSEKIAVMLSTDGKQWQTVATKTSSQYPVLSSGRADIEFDFGGAYKARFVKFSFTISAHCWLDELSAYGTKKLTSDAKDLTPDIGSAEDMYEYPSLDILGGSENILLAYNYKVENRSAGLRSKEQYLPLVGYYDTDGELKDFFFDSFLYLPCSTTCPSGGLLWASDENPSIMSDWLDYEDDLYKDGYNIKALNEAVGEVKTALGQPDYKAYVYLSIFNSSDAQTDFGDVDGDGISEDMSKLENRKKVAKWWIDRNISRYNESGFENLKLNGFYWYDENLNLSNENSREIVTYITEYVHSLGYYIVWIPYYQASGFSSWKEAGFDIANMQPNYMFRENYTESVLYDNATLTKMLGMGVEIEIDGKALNTDEYYKRYMAYLRAGAKTGYMNTIKMYYSDAVPGVYLNAYNSKVPGLRAIYDVTYKYAKRQLTIIDGLELTKDTVETEQGKTLKGTLESAQGIASVSVKYCPRHGIFAVAASGSYKYTPDAGFIGTDKLTLVISDGFNESTVTLTFNVK